ncbi:MAG TPA: hypothetical protein VGM16_06835 [Gammaproteobacteria bacterium]
MRKKIALLLASLALPALAWADDTTSSTTTTNNNAPVYGNTTYPEDEGGPGFGVHASTLGYGAEFNFTANPYLVVRFDYNYYNDYSYTTTKNQINYDAHLHLENYGAALDWHPMAGMFLVSLGLFKDNNHIDAVAQPSSNYIINGNSYPASLIGQLDGHVTFNNWAPYVGVGWNTLGSTDKGLGFELGLGVFYQGSPKVSLQASGPIASVPLANRDVLVEQQRLQDDWNNYRYYPVVNLGLVFRF